MSGRRRLETDGPGWSRLVAAIFTSALLAVLSAVAAGAAAPSRADSDSYDLAHDPAAQQAVRETKQAYERRRAFRASPEGKRARQRSRTAYARASKGEALALARDEFGPAIAAPPVHGLDLPHGQRLIRYMGTNSALVARDGSDQRAIVHSTLPLRTDAGNGSLQPTDLRLRQTTSGFETTNAPVPVKVSSDLSQGVSLPGSVALRPEQMSPTASAQLVSGKAFFADAAADTDLWVAPRPDGAEILTQIRSPAAPELITFDVGMPAGSELRMSNPGDSVEIAEAGKVIARIAPPAAYDADGVRVPMSYQVDGSRLLVTVSHLGGDYRYPILTDPVIDRLWGYGYPDPGGWQTKVQGTGWWGFGLSTGDPFGRPWWGRGLWIYDWPGADYTTYWSGEWLYDWPPTNPSDPNYGRTSYITQLDATSADFDPRSILGVSLSCQTFGIWNPNAGAWDGNPVLYCSQHTGWSPTVTAGPAGDFSYGNPGDHATMLLWTTQSGSGASQTVAQVDRLVLTLSDRDNPSQPSLVHSEPPSTWGDTGTRTVTPTATDSGLGMKRFEVRVPAAAAAAAVTSSCQGGPDSPCARPLTLPYDYPLDSLPEGTVTASARAFDAIDHPSTLATWDLKIDHTPPNVALSGTLYDRRGQELPAGSYTLHVDATDGDGTPSGSRSGVHTVAFYVDGEEQDSVTQSCTAGNCQVHRDFTYDTADYGGGPHDVHVVATDELGHERETAPFTVNQPCCLTASASWGAYPPATYDFVLGDVDRDGAADAVVRDRALGTVSVGISTEGGFAPLTPWGSFPLLNDMHLADVNGDGRDDLVGRAAGGSDVQVALSSGSSFAAPASWGSLPATHSLYATDMDGDGLADVAGRSSSGDFMVAYSRETSFGGAYSWGSFDPAYTLSLADVDGDDGADLVGRSRATGDVRVAISQAGYLDPPSSWATVPIASDVAFGDGDGDGPADLIVRDPITGAISFRSSNASGFGPATPWGSFDSSHALGAVDMDGDGLADLAGRRALAGDVLVAQSRAPLPDLPLAEDYVPTPADIESEPPAEPPAEETGTAQAKAAAASTASDDLKIAFQDDRRLLARAMLVQTSPSPSTPWRNSWEDGNDPEAQATAEERINHIYDRMAQAGASIVRFNVQWSFTENMPDPTHPSGWPDGEHYYFDHLDAAVRLARAKKFDVLLTLTGGGASCPNYDQVGRYNPTARVCRPGDPSTIVDPDPAAYGDFVRAVVERYTRFDSNHAPLPASDKRFVRYFSFWNEPNVRGFLQTANEDEFPIHLYHDLVVNGWNAYSSSIGATPQVSGTKAFVGELASPGITGYIAGNPDCPLGQEPGQEPKKCKLSATEFLARVARARGEPIVADGLAHHPYQEQVQPWSRGYGKRQGIGKLTEVSDALDRLCEWSEPNQRCMGPLRGPHQKKLRLYLTEFGYRNRPTGDDNATFTDTQPARESATYRYFWHTEKRRALWFRGGIVKGVSRRGAFARARLNGVADWLLLYHATELQPAEEDPEPLEPVPPEQKSNFRNLWDSGVIGRPGIDNPDDDITGIRDYGKRNWYRGSGHDQKRLAYCAIHVWAVQAKYPRAKKDNNKCP